MDKTREERIQEVMQELLEREKSGVSSYTVGDFLSARDSSEEEKSIRREARKRIRQVKFNN